MESFAVSCALHDWLIDSGGQREFDYLSVKVEGKQ